MNFFNLLNQNIFSVNFYVNLAVLILAETSIIIWRSSLKKIASRVFLYSGGFVFAYLIYISFLQYRAFQSGALSFIIGTGKGIQWFFSYIFFHYWDDYLISLSAAVIFLLVARYFNKKYEERFFETEELWLAATGIFLVGYPAWLFYLVIVLLLSAIVSAIFMKKGERLPLYHFWIPTAIVILVAVQFWAEKQVWWLSFRF